MSRTFRHRHLPRVNACPLKFIDAGARTANRMIDERVESWYAHVLHDAPCLYGDPTNYRLGWKHSHSRCTWAAKLPIFYWRYENSIRSELGFAYPVGRTGSHPWTSWFSGGNPGKTFERRRGHRAIRRRTHQLLQRFIGPENPSWKNAKDSYFDEDGMGMVRMDLPGDISARWYVMEEAFPTTKIEIDPWSWD
jgi:hypothetical protein